MVKKRIDQLGRVITSPSAALREIAREAPLGMAIVILILTSLVPLFTPDSADALDYLGELGLAQARWTTWGVNLLVTVAILALVHWLSRAYVSTGNWRGFVAAFGFAAFPRLLEYPLLLMRTTALDPVARLASAVVSIWVLVLSILAVRESYELRTGAAILTYVLAAIISFVLVAIIAAILLFAGLAGSLS